MTKKTAVENELMAGLHEVLNHKRGKKTLRGSRRELTPPAPEWSARQIKMFREKTLSMSQTEFAALLNVKPPTIRAWEQGFNVPSGAAARLLQALELDPKLLQLLTA
jgi:DNA-binding transcriptional regulator YiaG